MGPFNHICFYLCSTLIHFRPVIEQQLYDQYLFAVNMGEWGLYDALTPTEKNVCVPKAAPGGTMWVSNGLMVWSILTLVVVVCRLTILFFSPRGIYVPCI